MRRLIRPTRIVLANRQHTRIASIARRLRENRRPQICTDVHRFEPYGVPIGVDLCPSVAKHNRASSRATTDRASVSMVGVNETSQSVKAMATIGSYSAKRYSYLIQGWKGAVRFDRHATRRRSGSSARRRGFEYVYEHRRCATEHEHDCFDARTNCDLSGFRRCTDRSGVELCRLGVGRPERCD